MMIGFIFLFMGRLAGDPLTHDLWSLIDSLTGVIRLIKQTFSIHVTAPGCFFIKYYIKVYEIRGIV